MRHALPRVPDVLAVQRLLDHLAGVPNGDDVNIGAQSHQVLERRLAGSSF